MKITRRCRAVPREVIVHVGVDRNAFADGVGDIGPLIDLAIEVLDLTSRKMILTPIQYEAIGLASARWRNVSPEERSEALRRAVQARWAKKKAADEQKSDE